jgi:hypothetical protein
VGNSTQRWIQSFTRELSTIPNRGAAADRGGIGRSAEPRFV